jgi:hypothetical protein
MCQEQERMRLSREVRIGELLAMIVALAGLAAWALAVQLEPIRAEIRALQARNDQQDVVQLELKREIRDDLKVLRDKIDRLLEGQPQRRLQ